MYCPVIFIDDEGIHIESLVASLKERLGFNFGWTLVNRELKFDRTRITTEIDLGKRPILLISWDEKFLSQYKKKIFVCQPLDIGLLRDDAWGSGFLSFRDFCRFQNEQGKSSKEVLEAHQVFVTVPSPADSHIFSATVLPVNAAEEKAVAAGVSVNPSIFSSAPSSPAESSAEEPSDCSCQMM